MYAFRSAVGGLTVLVALAGWVLVGAGQEPTRPPLPFEPLGRSGEAVFPAVEGWIENEDGTFTLLVGYFNRNDEQTLDIPVGPNNRIEPGGPDRGQPTHFLPGRHYGVFTLKFSKEDASANRRLTWTIVANGQTSEVALGIAQAYTVEPFRKGGDGNTPPVIKFAESGPEYTGPPTLVHQTIEGTVGQPVTLRVWVNDAAPTIVFRTPEPPGGRAGPPPGAGGRGDPPAGAAGRGGGRGGRGGGPQPAATVTWFKHSGPGNVTFDPDRLQAMERVFTELTTTATFDAPGTYVVRAQVNDSSGNGGGGDQCCWTNGHVRVNVK